MAQFFFERNSAVSLVAMLASIVIVGSGCDQARQTTQDKPRAVVGAASLEIDFGGQRDNLDFTVDVRESDTVLEILERLSESGDVDISVSGTGEMAFVKSIEGVANRGATGENWIIRINGDLAKRGCGSVQVQPDDKVKWTFEEYSPE